MFLLSRPDGKQIEEFLQARENDRFSYPEVGSTRKADAPSGYNVDHNRQSLSTDDETFERAKQAVRDWKMFDFPWVRLCYPDTPIEVGRTVAVVIKHFGFFSINATRIVYTIDEPKRFGFAYGTLTEHGEIGEERFSVEISESGDVWYDLYAFSRPSSLFARLGYPLTRYLQKRFAVDSKSAMLDAVAGLR
ncbi:MAG TPA: DUF1990 domain-containing protein [Pyrinomonadaceae bacterium]|jgi:uncharacterized protein (UPF0548 family)